MRGIVGPPSTSAMIHRASSKTLTGTPINRPPTRRPAILHEDARPAGARVSVALVVQFMEQSVTDNLELLIAEMARHQAHRHQCLLAEATRQIHTLVAEAHDEYRASGAPFGD